MTTNQMIDGVSCDLLERIYRHLFVEPALNRDDGKKLRALLDAPAKLDLVECDACPTSGAQPQGEPVANPVLAYADSYRAMLRQGVENVSIWSIINDLERNIAPLYAEQSQGESVAWLAQAIGQDGEVYRNAARTTEITLRDVRFAWGQGVIDRFTVVIKPLYAEQPAPVAAVLPERLPGDDGVCTESHYASGWNSCLDEVTRLNAVRPAHANPPPGTEPSGTHPHNDGLDEMRKP